MCYKKLAVTTKLDLSTEINIYMENLTNISSHICFTKWYIELSMLQKHMHFI